MKMTQFQKGQSLVIFALVLIGMLAIAALVVDGGMTYAHRRTAQAAADAGAMAGARELCETGNTTLALNRAMDYTTTRNLAVSADVTVDAEDRSVEVIARIPFNTFFARLIGRPQITAEAVAEVACVNPGFGEGVMPVAWSCRQTIDPVPDTDPELCNEQVITWDELQERLEEDPPPPAEIWPELYMLMDSLTLVEDVDCDYIDAVIMCDMDGDGNYDVNHQADRSWMDLDGLSAGGQGAVNLCNWIRDGVDFEIPIHSWLPSKVGVANSIFNCALDRVNTIVTVPVFDAICEGEPRDVSACSTWIHAQDNFDRVGSSSATHFHVIGFAPFYITCVSRNASQHCPGKDRAMSLGLASHNTATIEGYFLHGYIPGLGGEGGIDTGAYNLLIRR